MTSEHASKVAGGDVETIEGEHKIQVGLLDALRDALSGGEGAGDVGEMLDRACEYSRLHFLSEELLMRRHAYPQHDEHVAEHHRMMDELDAIGRACAEGRRKEALDGLKTFRARLLGHIHAHDEELSRYIGG